MLLFVRSIIRDNYPPFLWLFNFAHPQIFMLYLWNFALVSKM